MIKGDGIINDPQTALDVALTIATEIYGDRVLEQKPYKVNRDADLWNIPSSVPIKYRNINYLYHGCFHITLNKYNGEIYEKWAE